MCVLSFFLQCTMESYVSRFQWDIAKFPLRQPLPGIVDGISKVCACVCIIVAQCISLLVATCIQHEGRREEG